MSMPGAKPAGSGPGRGGAELRLRIASALVLAPLAIGCAYLGGWWFAAFWSAAAVVVAFEWGTLVSAQDATPRVVMAVAVMLALALMAIGLEAGVRDAPVLPLAALAVLGLGMLVVAGLALRQRRLWAAAGLPYAAAVGLAPMVLRADPEFGLMSIIMLFAVVWTTDIAAYFVGRAIGGAKLAPRLSPNKTWSGAVGGLLGAMVAAFLVVVAAGRGSVVASVLIAAILSMAAQGGDLFESALKRRFGVKDAGHLIPGHGGLMDRLDGFVAAASLACLIGLVHRGLEAPARGLLQW